MNEDAKYAIVAVASAAVSLAVVGGVVAAKKLVADRADQMMRDAAIAEDAAKKVTIRQNQK